MKLDEGFRVHQIGFMKMNHVWCYVFGIIVVSGCKCQWIGTAEAAKPLQQSGENGNVTNHDGIIHGNLSTQIFQKSTFLMTLGLSFLYLSSCVISPPMVGKLHSELLLRLPIK